MMQPSLDGSPGVMAATSAEYASHIPEMLTIPRGTGSGGGFLPESMTGSRRRRSHMESPSPSVSFQDPYTPPRTVREGTYPFAGYAHQGGSHRSFSPWESAHPPYYQTGFIPAYNGQHEGIPSPRSVRYSARSNPSSNGSSGSQEHTPNRHPFVVMHEHPVPIWDRYVSVHPFHRRPSVPSTSSSPSISPIPIFTLSSSHLPPPASYSSTSSTLIVKQVLKALYVLLFDHFPRHLYLCLLLGLPSLYFTRVARVFEDAELSKPDIKKMVHTTANEWEGRMMPSIMTWNYTSQLSPALLTFKRSWEEFVDSLMREWKTLNIISVLLLSALLTVLQIQGAGNDPVTRTAALTSLICALMSLTYGCMFIVRFGTMKKMHKASSWADEAQKTDTFIWWNVWVLLAMPAVWLAWSMALFVVCILSFTWRTGSTLDPANPSPLTPHVAMGVRAGISGVLALGLLYALMIVKTLKRYGSRMDEAWTNRALAWRVEDLPQPLHYRRPGSDGNMRHPNKYEPIYGTRTQALLYKPPREDSVSPTTIPVILPRTGLDACDSTQAPAEVSSMLFSSSVPNPVSNLPQQASLPTPPAPQSILPSEVEIISRPSTPVPPRPVTILCQQPARPDDSDAFTMPSFLFRPAKQTMARPMFASVKIHDDMASIWDNASSHPSVLLQYDVDPDEWLKFTFDLSTACAGRFLVFGVEQGAPINQSDLIADLVDVWNDVFFCPRGLQVSVKEDCPGSPPIAGETKKYGLYLHCFPEKPVSEFELEHFQGHRLSSITERTEQSSLENGALGRLRSLSGGYDNERVVT